MDHRQVRSRPFGPDRDRLEDILTNNASIAMRALLLLPLPFVLGGCLVRTAADIVTAPIKVGSAVIDAASTSQSEADEKRGREIRKAEEREAKERRRADKDERERIQDEVEPESRI
jgi:hypothetical protein